MPSRPTPQRRPRPFWSSSALPAGEAWPAWRKPPASWWATCCFPPGGAGVGAGVVFPPRHLGQRLCHRGKPGAALPRFPNPLRPGGRRRNHRHWPGCPCAGETVVSPGRRPAGGIARRGEDPAVSIRPSCQGLGTGKIETAPENSSAVSPCLVRFGEGT